MEEKEKKLFEKLYDHYKKSNMLCFGSPDQFQYRQNQLLPSLVELILYPYLKEKNEGCEPPNGCMGD